MHIRTITVGTSKENLEQAAQAAQLAQRCLENAGYTIQTVRLAVLTSSFNQCANFTDIACGIEEQAHHAGFNYVSLGSIPTERLVSLPTVIANTQTLFASAHITDSNGLPEPTAIHAVAHTISTISAQTELGFGNLRFAALAHVAPGSPFFPAAYHNNGPPWLAIGPEASTLAIQAITDSNIPLLSEPTPLSYTQINQVLIQLTTLIKAHHTRITTALVDLEAETGISFRGCDWSLAPYPDAQRSVGTAIEVLSGTPFGTWGTLAAVAQLTAAIRAAHTPHLGFSGVMLPVLEDTTLARRNNEGRYTLRDLLAFSAVCGTGLDTIPLPSNTAPHHIEAILTEVATLASALRKPLTARLLPIPGLQAGDMTHFNFEYFVNTRVMPFE